MALGNQGRLVSRYGSCAQSAHEGTAGWAPEDMSSDHAAEEGIGAVQLSGRLRAFTEFVIASSPEALRPMIEHAAQAFVHHRNNTQVCKRALQFSG